MNTATEVQDNTAIVRQIEALAAERNRIIVAVAGPPGCGKSTLASELIGRFRLPSRIVPMDGFHLDNDTLSKVGLLHTKGAPETFDLESFTQLIAALRRGTEDRFPTFDRGEDRVIPDSGKVPSDTRILIVEGNYLLFDEPGWVELVEYWDASIWIDVPEADLEHRLVQRWIDHGLPEKKARERAHSNDMVNMRRVIDRALPATWCIGS